MSPGRDESFPALFARLDAEARQAFVAALYASRGRETRVKDGSIVATRDGQTRRIAIVQPRRFGTTSLPDVDTVVVTTANETVQTTAEARGMDYETPTDLRDRLLYGLGREDAADLFRQHFDRPLSAIESTTETDGTVPLPGSTMSAPALTAQRVRVAVALLLVAIDRDDGSIQWRQSVGYELETVMATPEGVFVESSVDDPDGGILVRLDAFALDGTRRWQTTTDIAIGGTVEALGSVGDILVVASEHELAAYDPASGSRRWQYDPESYRIGVAAADDALYVSYRDTGGLARLPTG